MRSEWGLKEVHYCLRPASKAACVCRTGRIFKVLKTDVPLAEQPPELRAMLGYEF
jgi:hypothetical protein